MRNSLSITLAVLLTVLLSTRAQAQLSAPTCNWSAQTQYINTFEEQDPIYLFFAANNAKLVASHTTNDTSSFVWKRYDSNNKVFVSFQTDSLTNTSELTNISEGGYQVEITNAFDSVEVFTAWVFIDDITLNSIDYENDCLYLQLLPKTTPNAWDIEYDRFVYWDISTSMHTVNNTYGKSYFSNITWESSEENVTIPTPAAFNLIIESPAPLYDSQYSLKVINPFGRELTAQTTIVPAIAVQATQAIKVFEDDDWTSFTEGEGYEALLEFSIASEGINADSMYWRLSKKDYSTYDYSYVIFWRDSSEFNTDEIFPDKSRMTPGSYEIQHLVRNTQSGCIDSITAQIEVDSSMIKEDAIPNVFSPSIKDGSNDVFAFISPEENIRSMRSCLIRIYNRSGNLMHEYDGDPKEWPGWDGNVKDSNRLAPQGIYFFIIECVGWDGKKFKRGPYKGTLYLY